MLTILGTMPEGARMDIEIIIVNPVLSKCVQGKEHVKKLLSYPKTYWIDGMYGKKQKKARVSLVNRKGLFYTGLTEKVSLWAQKMGYSCLVRSGQDMMQIDEEVIASGDYVLDGVTLRDDQVRFVETALERRRGVLVMPTGGGKTCIAMAIMKAFTGSTILFLVPTLDLIKQTLDELEKFKFKHVGFLGDGRRSFGNRKIVVSTYQTFVKMAEEYGSYFDVVIVDECHISVLKQSSYEKILTQVMAPVRLGLTATLPTDEEKRLVLEGLLGPVLERVTWEEGREINMLAEPELRLVAVPKKEIDSKMYYDQVYDECIVRHKMRNFLILDMADELIDEGRSVLIFIWKIPHGEILYEMAVTQYQLRCKFVRGMTGSDDRNQIKKDLEIRKLDLVIASTVWKEGVNIPSLGSIILAAGGKSEIALLQAIGRGLRRTKEKETAVIVDFIDIAKYLSEHFCERLSIYKELGWIK
jgi:superfamily II DNA or RNA helicase